MHQSNLMLMCFFTNFSWPFHCKPRPNNQCAQFPRWSIRISIEMFCSSWMCVKLESLNNVQLIDLIQMIRKHGESMNRFNCILNAWTLTFHSFGCCIGNLILKQLGTFRPKLEYWIPMKNVSLNLNLN